MHAGVTMHLIWCSGYENGSLHEHRNPICVVLNQTPLASNSIVPLGRVTRQAWPSRAAGAQPNSLVKQVVDSLPAFESGLGACRPGAQSPPPSRRLLFPSLRYAFSWSYR
jgi:hypothetical protein